MPRRSAPRRIARSRKRHEEKPDGAVECNELAWAYLISPQPLRNPDQALVLALKATRLAPDDPIFRNTLGVAYYRLARSREAVEPSPPISTSKGIATWPGTFASWRWPTTALGRPTAPRNTGAGPSGGTATRRAFPPTSFKSCHPSARRWRRRWRGEAVGGGPGREPLDIPSMQ